MSKKVIIEANTNIKSKTGKIHQYKIVLEVNTKNGHLNFIGEKKDFLSIPAYKLLHLVSKIYKEFGISLKISNENKVSFDFGKKQGKVEKDFSNPVLKIFNTTKDEKYKSYCLAKSVKGSWINNWNVSTLVQYLDNIEHGEIYKKVCAKEEGYKLLNKDIANEWSINILKK